MIRARRRRTLRSVLAGLWIFLALEGAGLACETTAMDTAGAVAGSLLYTPVKLLFAGSGAILSLFASPASDVSSSIYSTSVGGDYLVTPEQVGCNGGPQFFGADDEEADEDEELREDPGTPESGRPEGVAADA